MPRLRRLARFLPTWKRRARAIEPQTIVAGGLVAGTLGVTALGFLLGLDGFLGNTLSEVAGVSLSVLVALALVDRFVRHQRQRAWARVRDALLDTLLGT